MYFTLLIYPFSKPTYRKINYWVSDVIWGFWGYIITEHHKVQICYTGDQVISSENAIIISNHQSWSDILIIIAMARKAKMTANLKWMAKSGLKYIPLIGWGMHFIDCIFLKRDWAKDRNAIEKTFEKIVKNNISFWLTIFPEGTRQTPEKLIRSQEISKQKGLQVWRHVMLPKPRGLAASIHGLRPNLQAIYSFTIHYHDQPIPSPAHVFAGLVGRVDVHIRRYSLDEIKLLDTEKAVKNFLMIDFQEKERWIASLSNRRQNR
jgi:1-acyl-sn-glycerol-3-phosphate acyltransferase